MVFADTEPSAGVAYKLAKVTSGHWAKGRRWPASREPPRELCLQKPTPGGLLLDVRFGADFVAKVGCIRRMLVSHAVEATDFGVPA
jgi:hypothetical protein